MPRLIDEMAEVLSQMHVYFSQYVIPLVVRYDDMRMRETEEAKLTEDSLVDEFDKASDYTALSPEYSNWDLPENVDEWGQGYGRCPMCGMPWDIVRPGKGQPACECHA